MRSPDDLKGLSMRKTENMQKRNCFPLLHAEFSPGFSFCLRLVRQPALACDLQRFDNLDAASKLQLLSNMEFTQINRRQLVGGLAASIASLSALPSLAGQTTMNPTSLPPAPLQDPKTKYPVPPFKGQSQPWPGLASKMDPVPDHGEKAIEGQIAWPVARR